MTFSRKLTIFRGIVGSLINLEKKHCRIKRGMFSICAWCSPVLLYSCTQATVGNKLYLEIRKKIPVKKLAFESHVAVTKIQRTPLAFFIPTSESPVNTSQYSSNISFQPFHQFSQKSNRTVRNVRTITKQQNYKR